MVYVLIVVALFAALSFVLARQNDSESDILSDEKVEIYTGTILQAQAQLKQSVEQMLWTGSTINPPSAGTDNSIDFVTSDDGNFDVGSPANKLFHPQGGGVILPRIPDEALEQISADPPARWYIGRFNDVGWGMRSQSDIDNGVVHDDIILTAHQIRREICARINEKLTGDPGIPELVGRTVREVLIDEAASTSNSNFDFDATVCPACEGEPALCVKDLGVNAWSFYSLIATE